MNPLLSRFPRSVKVRGTSYAVGWDFRTCIRLVQINEDPALAAQERLELMLNLFYEEIPQDWNEAVRLMAKFLNAGEEQTPLSPEEDGADAEEPERPPRLFSYEKDGVAIYTAVLQTYGVDLESDTVHWWKFLAMLRDLKPLCGFRQLLHLRQGWLDGTLSKEELETMKALGEARLPPEEPMEPEEQAAVEAFLAELEGGEQT